MAIAFAANGSNSGTTSLSTGAGSEYALEQYVTPIALNHVNQAFTDIFSETGGGFVLGFSVTFNSRRVRVRLEVDGEEAFDVDVEEMDLGGSEEYEFANIIKYNTHGYKLSFGPPLGISYGTSFKIQAKANTTSTMRESTAQYISIVRES